MKITRLETHDRFEYLMKDQAQVIAQGAEDCLKRNPNSVSMQQYFPYIYIFAHPRTADDGVTKRLLWMPYLIRPTPQPNSYCFRALSNTDILEVCWTIPAEELWNQYQKGNVTANDLANWSINQYLHNKKELARNHPDDWSDGKIRKKLLEIDAENKTKFIPNFEAIQ